MAEVKSPRSIFHNPEIQTPAPVLDHREEKASHAGLSASLTQHYSDDAINRRLAAIDAESEKLKRSRDESRRIKETAERLAHAIVRKSE